MGNATDLKGFTFRKIKKNKTKPKKGAVTPPDKPEPQPQPSLPVCVPNVTVRITGDEVTELPCDVVYEAEHSSYLIMTHDGRSYRINSFADIVCFAQTETAIRSYLIYAMPQDTEADSTGRALKKEIGKTWLELDVNTDEQVQQMEKNFPTKNTDGSNNITPIGTDVNGCGGLKIQKSGKEHTWVYLGYNTTVASTPLLLFHEGDKNNKQCKWFGLPLTTRTLKYQEHPQCLISGSHNHPNPRDINVYYKGKGDINAKKKLVLKTPGKGFAYQEQLGFETLEDLVNQIRVANNGERLPALVIKRRRLARLLLESEKMRN